VDPHPHIPQEQSYRHEQQSQVWLASAGINPGLTPLAVARFDPEPTPVHPPDLLWRPLHFPAPKEQLLLFAFAVLTVLVSPVSHTHRQAHLLFAALERMRVPAHFLPFDPPQAGESLMKPLLQDLQRFGQAVSQCIEDRLVGRCVAQIATGSIDRTGPGCRPQHDAQDHHGGAFPAVILELKTFAQPAHCPLMHLSAGNAMTRL